MNTKQTTAISAAISIEMRSPGFYRTIAPTKNIYYYIGSIIILETL